MDKGQELTIGAVALRFMADLSPEDRERGAHELYNFARWLGWDRPVGGITGPMVARYGEQLSSGTGPGKDVSSVRAFLSYIKKEGYVESSLAAQLKVKKGKASPSASFRQRPVVSLTRQGYRDIEAQLESLKSRRLEVTAEMHRAAADKDFRENAPLQAAREERGHLEGRIAELEETLKSAVIIDERQADQHRIGIGDSVVLKDLDSGEEVSYILVSSKEVDLRAGKISCVSPLGKAIVGQAPGQTIEVVTPGGRLRYRICQQLSSAPE